MKVTNDKIATLGEIRRYFGHTQREVARALGISPSLYCLIEQGERRPCIDTMHRLSILYETSMDYLYHSFYTKSERWIFPESLLAYGLREARKREARHEGWRD